MYSLGLLYGNPFFKEQFYGLLEQINLISYINLIKFKITLYFKHICIFLTFIPIFLNGLALFMFNYIEKKGKIANFIFFNKINGFNKFIELFHKIVANKDTLEILRVRCKSELLLYIFILIYFILFV